MKIGTEFDVYVNSVEQPDFPSYPHVVGLSNGGFAVTWYTENKISNVFLRTYLLDGSPNSDATALTTRTLLTDPNPVGNLISGQE